MDGKLIDRIRGARRIAALTGAGISTASGIPDYRGPEGVWTRTPSAVNAFTLENFMADSAVRREFWRSYAGHAAWRAEPNAAHRALAELDAAGVAVRVLTQNVDGLHQRAGLAARKVLGQALLDTGDVDGAIAQLQIGLKLAPESPSLHFTLARAYQKAGRLDDANKERDEFTRLDRLARETKAGPQSVGGIGRGGSR